MTEDWSISCKITIIWIPFDLTNDKSAFVQVMDWCHQPTSHYQSRYWHRYKPPYDFPRPQWINTLRPRQNGSHFPDDIFNSICLNENVWTPIKFSLKFVPKGPIENIPALVQIMAWRRLGDKPLSEPMIVRLPTHICVTRPQWVKVCILNLDDATTKNFL